MPQSLPNTASHNFSPRHARRANIANDQFWRRSTRPSRNPLPTGTNSLATPRSPASVGLMKERRGARERIRPGTVRSAKSLERNR